MTNPKDLLGVKQSEIQKCIGCNKGVMHDKNLTFYILNVKYLVSDLGAMQRQHGLEMSMGAVAPLAQFMGPDEDIAKQLSSNTAWVCMDCAMMHPLAVLQEMMGRMEESGDG